ncbi:DUF6111 family protein [Polymorphum gilvum]|uniref:Uncharacterized protein n=1 Tax=Polymorphum gilvum (strain LMG 25793 / CGMCC 1.9160 / SL003B-26A1) TaxID=991905 RepID=F2IZN5_POLGS|nr:DUF6111 family protein [Polymorphum gilvum]ADZ69592.1 hypothetical protein SL003B_1163 [Polymorphum gilvum SL003B-26A1]
MVRVIFTHLVLFLLPFAFYALWLWVSKKEQTSENWRKGPIAWLVIVGAVLVSISLGLMASFDKSPEGLEYRPAEIRDGVFVPGRFE